MVDETKHPVIPVRLESLDELNRRVSLFSQYVLGELSELEPPPDADYATVDYVDAGDAANEAYADAGDAATSAADRAYADAQDDSHSAADRAYADVGDIADRAYADSQDDSHSAADRSYTDSQDAAHVAAPDPHTQYLKAVAEDTAPVLGGELQTKGSHIILTRADDSEQARIATLQSQLGAFFGFTDAGAFDEDNGAFAAIPARAEIYGATMVNDLRHSDARPRIVVVNQDGTLSSVEAPTPGWSAEDYDNGDYNLGSGETPGNPERINLAINPAEDILVGQRIDVSVSLYMHLGKDGDPTDLFDKSSSVNIGFGINQVHSGEWPASQTLGPYFTGFVVVSFSFVAENPISTTDTIDVFARRGTGEDDDCNPWVYGSGNPGSLDHYLFVGKP